jgi:hypothetical protein
MKWHPSEFWAATPYDCLLASGGLAKIRGGNKNELNKSDIARLRGLIDKDRLKNGKD